jgi:hypothetical protein
MPTDMLSENSKHKEFSNSVTKLIRLEGTTFVQGVSYYIYKMANVSMAFLGHRLQTVMTPSSVRMVELWLCFWWGWILD